MHEDFVNYQHHMQKTQNCFMSKDCNKAFQGAEVDKHECDKYDAN